MGLFDYIEIGGGVAAGLAVGIILGTIHGESIGYKKRIGEEAVLAAKADAARKNDDAKLQDMSDYDVCVQYLSARGLSVEACNELSRVHP